MDENKLKQAIEKAKENPNSLFATELRRRIESGQFAGLQATTTEPVKEDGIIKKTASAVGGIAVGAGKGLLETLQNIGQATMALPSLLPGGKTFGRKLTEVREETGFRPETLEAKTGAEKVGKFAERVGEFIVPHTKIPKALGFFGKMFFRAGVSGAVATAQEGEVGKGTKMAVGAEIVLPVGGKLVINPLYSLLKTLTRGLGSKLAGVPRNIIDLIVQNPQKSRDVAKNFEKMGGDKILEKNAKIIMNGIAKIKLQARSAYGKALQKLKEVEVKVNTFRNSTQEFLDKVANEGVEFESKKNIKVANELMDRLRNTKLDGVSLRRLLNNIDDSRYKIATSEERLSFNAFLGDFSGAIKNALEKSTKVFGNMNSKFSTDMQIAENMERIFTKVKFKNLSEVGKMADKLENLFTQKGLKPRDINAFLEKIGIKPSEFMTTEGVRQIMSETFVANKLGLSFTESTELLTGTILNPNTVRKMAQFIGMTTQKLTPMLEKVSLPARATLIASLIEGK